MELPNTSPDDDKVNSSEVQCEQSDGGAGAKQSAAPPRPDEPLADKIRRLSAELALLQQRAAEAEAKRARGPPNDDDDDWVWGATAIGELINRTPHQVYYLHRIGALAGSVQKVGHRTFVGSRKRLRNFKFGGV